MENRTKFTKIILLFCLTVILANCDRKPDNKNQITITISSVDNETKKPRAKDTVVVIIIKPGFLYLTRVYGKKVEYLTDSLGSVKIHLDRTQRYKFQIYGAHVYSFAEYAENELKNGQHVIIDVVPPEKREYPFL